MYCILQTMYYIFFYLENTAPRVDHLLWLEGCALKGLTFLERAAAGDPEPHDEVV